MNISVGIVNPQIEASLEYKPVLALLIEVRPNCTNRSWVQNIIHVLNTSQMSRISFQPFTDNSDAEVEDAIEIINDY